MKKFFITLIILIILGGTAFFFGWVQFQIPPGQFGVITSKTHGTDPQVVRSGEFRWVWYRLLPTNVRITAFNLEHTTLQINYSGALPSGGIYAAFAGLANTDFSWDLQAEISFSINPDYLVRLASRHNLASQEDLDSQIKRIADDIEVIILQTLTSAASIEDTTRLESIMSGNRDERMEQTIKSRFPEIKDFSFNIRSAKFPDFILYTQLRLMYEEFLESQRQFVTLEFGSRAERHIQSQLRFNELERYGELLTRFPILLDYMRLGLDLNQFSNP
ncbi:MAG: hypothetical protein FWC97_09890 [Treponema sp.]|nr:hypothetical protein [Treponema sp.]